MSKNRSAGLLLYRKTGAILEVLLVHPGGPYWAGKDEGAWSIPKGEYEEGESPLMAAQREFAEETGFATSGEFLPLGSVKQKGGKWITAWAVEGDADPTRLLSNTFQMEWPPKSGRQREFPEVDRAAWFNVAHARQKLIPAQVQLLEALIAVHPAQ